MHGVFVYRGLLQNVKSENKLNKTNSLFNQEGYATNTQVMFDGFFSGERMDRPRHHFSRNSFGSTISSQLSPPSGSSLVEHRKPERSHGDPHWTKVRYSGIIT
jgi:hypothetical protein